MSRTPLDELSARPRDLYLAKHNVYKRHPCPRRDSNPLSPLRTAATPRLRRHGQWDRRIYTVALH